MNGLKIYFKDTTYYILETSNNYEINSIYKTSSGNKMIEVSLIYQDTPQSLILRNILDTNLVGKNINQVEWYYDDVIIDSISGNIQINYYAQTISSKIKEMISFNRIGPEIK